MEHGKGLVFCHIDLIQYAEAALGSTFIDGPLAEADLTVLEGVGTNQRGGIGVQVKGDVPFRAPEHSGEVFRQNVFAGGLGAYQQDVLPGQQGRQRFFPNVRAVIVIFGHGNPIFILRCRRVLAAKVLDAADDILFYSLLSQKIQHVAPPNVTAQQLYIITQAKGICH